MDLVDLSTFIPKIVKRPEPKQFVSGSGITVSSNGETTLVSAVDDPPTQSEPVVGQASADPYLEMDFRTFETEDGLRINGGEVSYAMWDGLAWIEARFEVDAAEVTFTQTDAPQYLHIQIPMIAHRNHSSVIDGPYVEADIPANPPAAAYSLASINEWQEPDGTASFVVGTLETRNDALTAGQYPDFSVLLASVSTSQGLRMYHCGPITIPQGYAANYVSL